MTEGGPWSCWPGLSQPEDLLTRRFGTGVTGRFPASLGMTTGGMMQRDFGSDFARRYF